MTLAIEMPAVEQAAQRMATRNHATYLRMVLDELRRPNAEDSVIEALRLLRVVWGGPYARRPEPLAALNDVGRWLERRIERTPGISPRELALEVAWLRRLAVFFQSNRRDPTRSLNPPRPTRSFGDRIADLVRIRKGLAEVSIAESVTPGQKQVAPVTPVLPPTPTVLPPSFMARFANIADARKAWSAAKKRKKLGKPAKERLLAIVPEAGELLPLTRNLRVSVQLTVGFDRYMEELASNPSRDIAFRVAEHQGDLVVSMGLMPSPMKAAL